ACLLPGLRSSRSTGRRTRRLDIPFGRPSGRCLGDLSEGRRGRNRAPDQWELFSQWERRGCAEPMATLRREQGMTYARSWSMTCVPYYACEARARCAMRYEQVTSSNAKIVMNAVAPWVRHRGPSNARVGSLCSPTHSARELTGSVFEPRCSKENAVGSALFLLATKRFRS